MTKRVMGASDPVRVLVVDDSVVIRRMVTEALETDPRFDVVGTAADGAIALQKMSQLAPDVVTLDVEMPGMNGLETLTQLRSRYPSLPVVMLSSATENGASITLEALERGASDYVAKSSGGLSFQASLARLQAELLPKLQQFFEFGPPAKSEISRVNAVPAHVPGAQKPEVVAIGVSTGGPTALSDLVVDIPANFPLPILVVQHMPALFTRLLAERLAKRCPLKVVEAEEGMTVERGTMYVAPGDFHMCVARRRTDVVITLEKTPPENSCRPSVDVLFRSVADVYGGAVIAVVMTGMGCDGTAGLRTLKAHGAASIAQDEATSIVWGMPGEVVRNGLADQVLPLGGIAGALVAGAQADGKSKQGVVQTPWAR